MKVALVFFGLPRSTAETFASIESRLLGPLAACSQLSVFYHLWAQERVVNPRSGEDHALDETNYRPFLRFTGAVEDAGGRVEALSPEPLAAHGDAWDDGFRSFRNLLLQLLSLQAVTALAAKSDPDVVVFARPDMLYHDAVQPADIERAAARPREVRLPAWQWWGGHNDRFAICGRDAYGAYGNRLHLAAPFCKAMNGPLHSERLLWFALYAHGLDVHPMALRASRVRAGGQMVRESFEAVPPRLVAGSSFNPPG